MKIRVNCMKSVALRCQNQTFPCTLTSEELIQHQNDYHTYTLIISIVLMNKTMTKNLVIQTWYYMCLLLFIKYISNHHKY